MRSTPITSARFSMIRPSRAAAARPSSPVGEGGDVVGIDADREGLGGEVRSKTLEPAVAQRGTAADFSTR